MKLKSAMLLSASIVAISATQAQASDLYISVTGGGNWFKDASVVIDPTSTFYNIEADTGFVVGGAIGTSLENWAKGLRVELEATYRRNDLGGDWISSDSTTGTIDGNLSTFAIMANAWYDFDMGSKARPYIGGGIGWGRTKFDGVQVSSSGSDTSGTGTFEDSGFAWQVGVGFNYEVAPAVDVGFGYRYFSGPEVRDPFFSGKGTIENRNHAFQVNLTVGID